MTIAINSSLQSIGNEFDISLKEQSSAKRLVIDGLNILYYNTSNLTGKRKKGQQNSNMKDLIVFLEKIYPKPRSIVILPKHKSLLKRKWSNSGWFSFISDCRKSYDDFWLINYAIQINAFILSNDNFKEWRNTFNNLEDVVVKYEIINHEFIIERDIRQNLTHDKINKTTQEVLDE